MRAGHQAVASGATAVGAIVAIFDVRYGEARRDWSAPRTRWKSTARRFIAATIS